MHSKITFFFVLSGLLFVCGLEESRAVNEGYGRVSMQGAIIDAACAIEVDSRDQVIDMGIIPFADIRRYGQARSKVFTIRLENCVIARPNKPDWGQFQVTFVGERDGDYFRVYGDASGVALRIMDEFGNNALPSEALPLRRIVLDQTVLHYTLTLIPNQRKLQAGTYFSTLGFKLDYF